MSAAPSGPGSVAGPGGCPFCAIAAGRAPARVVARWPDAIAIVPLRPVTDGHLLVLPVRHVPDFTADTEVTATVMRRAAELAARPCNLIASAGAAASATIEHLHVHIVPRRPGDGLPLPWILQHAVRVAAAPTVPVQDLEDRRPPKITNSITSVIQPGQ
ncbi:HIT family protein [Kitasatospora griseola]|uniref:HIT family protein n=1 Tax=Kitasatospora griseola TaxID=2064 RepID=UPI00342B0B52